jgi:hypothetical protein
VDRPIRPTDPNIGDGDGESVGQFGDGRANVAAEAQGLADLACQCDTELVQATTGRSSTDRSASYLIDGEQVYRRHRSAVRSRNRCLASGGGPARLGLTKR